MKKKFQQSLFIFRRDLRIQDNTALNHALTSSEKVFTCFIFDPQQINAKKNNYKSNAAVQFMVESLQDLEKEIKKRAAN